MLSSVTYSPSHRQTCALTINIKSTLRTAPNLCKNVSLQCYLVAKVIHVQSVRCQICVYEHMLRTIWRLCTGTALNAACYFEHVCHSLFSPVLYKKIRLSVIMLHLVSWIGPTFHLVSPVVCGESFEELGGHVTTGTVGKWKI